MSSLEGLARPVIMMILVVSQVALAIMWALGHEIAKDAFAALGSFTMAVVVYLFKSRDEEKRTTPPPDTTVVSTVTTNTPPTINP